MEQLDNLQFYKYNGIDKSFLSRFVLNPFWNRLVLLFPKSMAPNLITLTGLVFMATAVIAVIYLNEHPSRLLYFYVAFCISTYLNMDAIDGKQARRTNTCSPLGELFDHGCDAINMMFMSILIPYVLGLPDDYGRISITLCGMAAFFASTWEEWHTGSLYLGYVSGPVEGAWSIWLVSMISGFWGGSDLWSLHLFNSFKIRDAAVSIFVVGSVVTILTSMLHVYQKSGLKAFKHLFIPLLYFTSCVSLSMSCPEYFRQKSSFYFFVFFTGIPICHRVSSTIVAYMTKSSLPKLVVMDIFPALMCIHQLVFGNGNNLATGLLLFSSLSYILFIRLVIWDLCDRLDINCLTIKRKD